MEDAKGHFQRKNTWKRFSLDSIASRKVNPDCLEADIMVQLPEEEKLGSGKIRIIADEIEIVKLGSKYKFDLSTLIFKKKKGDECSEIILYRNGKKTRLQSDIVSLNLKLVSILKSKCRLKDFKSFYDPINKLGSGSYARVYSCKRLKDGEDFAVKVYDKEKGLKKESHKASVNKEIKILRRLEHPNIMKIFEVFEGERHLYLITEYLQGKDLYYRVKESEEKFNEERIASILLQIISGIKYLHFKGYIHRDLKPANILFKDKKGFLLKIIDFGFVEQLSDEFSIKKCGTPGYLAPEIFVKSHYNEKVDIFSIGVIFCTMLTGVHPFKKENVRETLAANRKCDFSSIENIEIKSDAKELIMKMLSPFPDERESSEGVLRSSFIVKNMQNWQKFHTQPSFKEDDDLIYDKVQEYNLEAGNITLRKKEIFSTSSFSNSIMKNSYSPTRKSFSVMKKKTRKESIANMLSKSSLNPEYLEGSKTFISSPYSQYMNLSNSSNSRELALADSRLEMDSEERKLYSDHIEP